MNVSQSMTTKRTAGTTVVLANQDQPAASHT